MSTERTACTAFLVAILSLSSSTTGHSAEEPLLSRHERDTLQQLINRPERGELRERNPYRNPLPTLDFFEIHNGLTVVEIWPGGQSGWYRSILEPYLADHGNYLPVPGNSAFPDPVPDVPDGIADRVLVFRAHGFMIYDHPAQDYFDALYRMLKPGGLFGIVDHRADESAPQNPDEDGYVHQSHVETLARNAGFELIARAEINANPADTKNHPEGVYSLPPTLRTSFPGGFFNRDDQRERMLEIGESDRMTLKFRKPE